METATKKLLSFEEITTKTIYLLEKVLRQMLIPHYFVQEEAPNNYLDLGFKQRFEISMFTGADFNYDLESFSEKFLVPAVEKLALQLKYTSQDFFTGTGQRKIIFYKPYLPKSVDYACVQALNGIILRAIRSYDIQIDRFPCRFDVIFRLE